MPTPTLIGGQPADTSVLFAHPPTGLVGTDDAMLRDLISSVPVGGVARLGNGGDTPYAISGALVPTKSMVIEGGGSQEVFTPGTMRDGPQTSPFLRGSVILQTLAGANAITCNASQVVLDLRNFGIRFDDAIRHVNTGHGIESIASALVAGLPDGGLYGAVWSNVKVFGHDGNHYGFRMVNPIVCTFNHLRSYGGGGLLVEGNSTQWNFGNLVFIHPYMELYVGGSAHCISLRSVTANGMNLITMVRPQANIDNKPTVFSEIVASPTAAQYRFRANEPFSVSSLSIIKPDFEAGPGLSATPTAFGSLQRGYVDPTGITGTVTDNAAQTFPVMSSPVSGDGLDSNMRLTRGLRTPAPTLAVLQGAGAGAGIVLNAGDDVAGYCTLTTGTPLASPTGLAAAAVGSGGTFAAATYFWKVAALSALGETLPSAEATQTIALNGSATLTWNPVTNATGYKVYRSATTGGENGATSLVATLGVVTTYTDTGTTTTTGAVATFNSTGPLAFTPLFVITWGVLTVAPRAILLYPGTANVLTTYATAGTASTTVRATTAPANATAYAFNWMAYPSGGFTAP